MKTPTSHSLSSPCQRQVRPSRASNMAIFFSSGSGPFGISTRMVTWNKYTVTCTFTRTAMSDGKYASQAHTHSIQFVPPHSRPLYTVTVRCVYMYRHTMCNRLHVLVVSCMLFSCYEATLLSVHHHISVQCSEAYTNPHVAIEQAPIVLRHGHSLVRHQVLLPIHDNLLVCTHDTHTHGTHVSFAQGEKGSG